MTENLKSQYRLFNARLSENDHRLLEQIAKASDDTLTDVVRDLIRKEAKRLKIK